MLNYEIFIMLKVFFIISNFLYKFVIELKVVIKLKRIDRNVYCIGKL